MPRTLPPSPLSSKDGQQLTGLIWRQNKKISVLALSDSVPRTLPPATLSIAKTTTADSAELAPKLKNLCPRPVRQRAAHTSSFSTLYSKDDNSWRVDLEPKLKKISILALPDSMPCTLPSSPLSSKDDNSWLDWFGAKIKERYTMDQISIKTPNPKCRLFLKIYQYRYLAAVVYLNIWGPLCIGLSLFWVIHTRKEGGGELERR